MINLILCGGSGTRLWPVSRSLMPKQFAPLFDGQSLFRKTVVTNSAVCESQFIVSNADQFFLAKDQLETEGMIGSKFLFLQEFYQGGNGIVMGLGVRKVGYEIPDEQASAFPEDVHEHLFLGCKFLLHRLQLSFSANKDSDYFYNS